MDYNDSIKTSPESKDSKDKDKLPASSFMELQNKTVPSYLFKTSYGASLLRILATRRLTSSTSNDEVAEEQLQNELSISGLLGSSPTLFAKNNEYQRLLMDMLNERRKSANFGSILNSISEQDDSSNTRHGSRSRADYIASRYALQDEDFDMTDTTPELNINDEYDDGNEDDDDDDNDNDIDANQGRNNTSNDSSGGTKKKNRRLKNADPELLLFAFPTRWVHDKDFQCDISPDGLKLSTNNLKRPLNSQMSNNYIVFPNNSHRSSAANRFYSLKTNYPILREIGIFYYEVKITFAERVADISIGFIDYEKTIKANINNNSNSISNLRGGDSNAWGYNGKEGKLYSYETVPNHKQAVKFGDKDTIGCGVNFITSKIFYTKNGVYLGEAFDIPEDTNTLSPVISLSESNSVSTNFGGDSHKKFLFGIDSYVNSYKFKVLKNINHIRIPKFSLNLENIGVELDKEKRKDKLDKDILDYLPHKRVKNNVMNLSNKDFPDLLNYFVESYFDYMGYDDTSKAIFKDLELERQVFGSSSTSKANVNASDSASASTFGSPISESMNGVDTMDIDSQVISDDQKKRQEQRKLIKNLILNNDYENVVDLLNSEFPKLKNEAPNMLFKLQTLEFLNLIRNNDPESAMIYGNSLQKEYSSTHPEFVKYLMDISSLLVADDPHKSPLGFLLDPIEKSKLIGEVCRASKIDSEKQSLSIFDKILASTELRLNLARDTQSNSDCLLFDLIEDFLQV